MSAGSSPARGTKQKRKMHENIYFIVNALFFLGVVASLVFVVLTAIGSGFDMIQRRAYRNKKKWDKQQ